MTVQAHYTPTSLRTFRGHTPRIGDRVLIDPQALVLGDVELGDDVSVWPGAIVRGDMHTIRIGARPSAIAMTKSQRVIPDGPAASD